MVTASRSDSFSKNNLIDKPEYGIHIVKDAVKFHLLENTIMFERASKDKFSYRRESPNNIVEKLISIRTPDLEIEIVPTHPIYTPTYKTDYMFLRLSQQVFVSRNSTTEFFLAVPIEIGLFFTGSDIREHFDVFSCDQITSRYALYGQPEMGKLCKYAKVTPHAHEQEASSYVHARLRVIVENELDVGMPIGRIIFPIRDHDIYYHHSFSAFDDLKMILKERAGIKIADVVQQNDTGPKGWAKSPRTMQRTDLKFSMEMGFD